MSKILRKAAKLFGSTAAANQIAEYGSLANGTPTLMSGATADPDVIQALSQFNSGWFAAVIGQNSPAIEDMNALCYLFAYQIAYMMQTGVPEWNSGTTYYIGSMVSYNSGIYTSLTDSNLNNLPTDMANWAIIAGNLNLSIVTKTSNYTTTNSDDIILADTSGGSFTITVRASTGAVKKPLRIKVINSDNELHILPTGGDKIDNETTQTLGPQNASVEIIPDGGSNWYVF